MTADLLTELSDVALRTASAAARLLEEYSHAVTHDVSTKSSPTDLVSEADRASEARIFADLRSARPNDSVLGEEGAAHDGTSGISWVADPLDGTTNFVFGIPAFAVSLAALWDGRPVVGVVVDPSRKETWTATRGRGTTLNGSPCHVASGRSQLSTALVATGFGYRVERRAEQAALLPRLLPAVRDIRRFGSAALDLCWVACGRYDAYYESHLNEWDWAAGRVICEEAGGVVERLPGELLLASTQELSAPLAGLLTALQTG
ncbi:MAG TPA: inositol monophosphatase family protein [Acidimicrobiales bacterium]|nr:inositol monophosphatase family protein [Acidimicrobiales bacterium]